MSIGLLGIDKEKLIGFRHAERFCRGREQTGHIYGSPLYIPPPILSIYMDIPGVSLCGVDTPGIGLISPPLLEASGGMPPGVVDIDGCRLVVGDFLG